MAVKFVCSGENLSVLKFEASSTWEEVYQFQSANSAPFTDVSWASDGACFASVTKGSPRVVLTYSKRDVFASAEVATGITSPLAAVVAGKKKATKLFLGAKDSVSVFDVKNKRITWDFALKSPISCLSVNSNDTLLAAGCLDGSISLVNNVTNYVTNGLGSELNGGSEVSSLAFGGKSVLAVTSADGRVAFWDCNRSSCIKSFTEHMAPATGVAFSPLNENLVMTCGLDKRVVCYDCHERKVLSKIKASRPVTALEVFPNGQQILLGTSSGQIMVYDLRSFAEPLSSYTTQTSKINRIRIQPQGDDIMSTISKMAKTKEVTRGQVKLGVDLKESIKENVPSPTPPPPSGSGNSTRLSTGSQVFSPVRGLEVNQDIISPASLSAGSISRVNMSQDSLFSPLREFSDNGSPLVRSRDNSFGPPKTPVDSFNKGISTPLISPLTMIREEDLTDVEVPGTPDGDKAPTVTMSYDKSIESTNNIVEGPTKTSIKQPLDPKTIHTAHSEIQFKSALASTPFTSNAPGLAKKPPMATKSQEPPLPNESRTDIAAVMTAFPAAFMDKMTMDNVDHPKLGTESKESGAAQQPASVQQRYLLSRMEDVMGEVEELRALLWCMQYDTIRYFQNQKEEFQAMLQAYAVNDQLVQEVQRLRRENEELRKYF